MLYVVSVERFDLFFKTSMCRHLFIKTRTNSGRKKNYAGEFFTFKWQIIGKRFTVSVARNLILLKVVGLATDSQNLNEMNLFVEQKPIFEK